MTVTNGQEATEPASAQTREQAYDWLAAQLTHITPAEMRAAEHTFSLESPVADRMESRAAGRQAEGDDPEAGS